MSIRLNNVSHQYGQGTPFACTALEHVDLEIKKGEFVGIIGHTGSGKSTRTTPERSCAAYGRAGLCR